MTIPIKPWARNIFPIFALATALTRMPSAQADDDARRWIPYGSAGAEYNSNVFYRSGNDRSSTQNDPSQQPPGGGVLPGQEPQTTTVAGETPSDIQQRYVAGLEVRLPWGEQNFHGFLEGRRLQFDQFSQLDHSQYLLSGEFEWKLTEDLNGELGYWQERRMGAFSNRSESGFLSPGEPAQTELAIEHERNASGNFTLALTPTWRLQGGAQGRKLESPLQNAPDFQIVENSGRLGIKYLVSDAFASGVYGEYLDGRFEGTPGAGPFEQAAAGLSAEYSIDESNRMEARLGYAERENQAGSGSLSAVTGHFSYGHDVTDFTRADIQAFRRISSYTGGASTNLETGAGATLNWKPVEKTSLAVAYQWSQADLRRLQSASPAPERKDTTHLVSMKLTWNMLPWLALIPSTGYQVRNSEDRFADYETFVGGLELQARLE